MRATLLVALTDTCTGNCEHCTLRPGTGALLGVRALEKCEPFLRQLVLKECVVLCPSPLRHDRALDVIRILSELGRTVLMMHVSELRNLTRAVLSLVDELVVVTSGHTELEKELQRIKALLSQGYDRISVWLTVTGSYADTAKVYKVQSFCKRMGLSLRVGEPPYTSSLNVDPVEFLSKSKRVEVGLHYGTLYGYSATSAFIAGYPVTLLSKPLLSQCRTIYLSPQGTVSKCPLDPNRVPLNSLDQASVRKIVFSACLAKHPSVELLPVASISLRDHRTGVELTPEVLMLLEVIDQLKSFRAACEALGLSPSTYAEKVKSIERRLGFKLLLTARGGKRRGATLLTARAKQILAFYKRVLERVDRLLYVDKCRPDSRL